MNKRIFNKHSILRLTLIITFLILIVVSVYAVTVPAEDARDNNSQIVVQAQQYASDEYSEQSTSFLQLISATPLSMENIIVISVLGAVVAGTAGVVLGVTAKSANQAKKAKKEKQNDKVKQKEKPKDKDKEISILSDISSKDFDEDDNYKPSKNIVKEEIKEPIEEEPVVEAQEDYIEEEPVVEAQEDYIEEEPVVEAQEDYIEEEPVVEAQEDYIEEEPVVEAQKDYIEEEPVVEAQEDYIEKEVVATVVENTIEENNESEDEEESNEVFTFTHEGKIVRVRFVRSFTAKLIQGNELVQNSYAELKNHVLGYKNTKARMSFPFDSINIARQQLMKFVIRGKHLCVYYALTASDVPEVWHTELSEAKRYENVPVFIRIQGTTTMSRAIKMIDMLCEKNNLAFKGDQTIDYALPYEEDEPLIERKLIKVFSDGDVDGATIVKAKFGDKVSNIVSETENLEVVEIDEDAILDDSDDDDETGEVYTYNDGDKEVKIRLARSFTAKFIQSEALVQTSYSSLKNHILGYKEATDRISFPYDSINRGRQQLVKFVIRGKRLCVFFALNPDEVPDSYHSEVSIYKRYQNVPVFIRIKGSTTLDRAMKMIDKVCHKYNLTFTEDANIDYIVHYESNEQLIEKNLIKIYTDNGAFDSSLFFNQKKNEIPE